MIRFDGVSKAFETRGGDRTLAVSDVSLRIERNEFVCLVGPSGCGKSTLLRLAAGLLLPEQGAVSVDGELVREPRPGTGIVFQAPTLLPWATVLDNMLFPARMITGSWTGVMSPVGAPAVGACAAAAGASASRRAASARTLNAAPASRPTWAAARPGAAPPPAARR